MSRTAIVTGGDSGIGRATVMALSEAGVDVGFTYHRRQKRAEAAAEEARRTGARIEYAAKAGVGLLTRTMALELAADGITVDAVAPGEIATPMNAAEDTDVHDQDRPGIPVPRPGDAREIASVIAFLSSPGAGYVDGVSWVVDGGMPAMGPTGAHHLPDRSWRAP